LCNVLWQDKVYVPEIFIKMRNGKNSKEAYKKSIIDSNRTYITKEELCAFIWNFRFKEDAGSSWQDTDPWWQGKQPAEMKFQPNGNVDVITSWPTHLDERKWRFIKSVAGRVGPEGSFVQLNSFPPYIVSRFHNWGFIMQSCWVLWTSFSLPPKGACFELEDENLDINVDVMRKEAFQYNMGAQLHYLAPDQIVTFLQLLQHYGQDVGDLEEDI